MIIRQLIDYDTYTYTYLLADKSSRKAALIDPVLGQVDSYLQLLTELNLTLIAVLDTHVHADHITALGALHKKTNATTYVGNTGTVTCACMSLQDSPIIKIANIEIQVIYTPGHTDDSYCFYVKDKEQGYVFSGDTLLIRGTGRTDFQNGDAESLYDSLHGKLLTLANDTIVYPGHDYNGWTKSTIEEEKKYNPRLKIIDRCKFVEHMTNLNLPNPKHMDIVVPANLSCGKNHL